MGVSNDKEVLFNAIKSDSQNELMKYIPLLKPNEYINENKTFTLLNISSSYGSVKCSKLLINKGWDINIPEVKYGNSPLLLSCKFGHFNLVKMFLEEYKADIRFKNYHNFNCLDLSIIYGQLQIAEYLTKKHNLKIIRTIDEYKSIIKKFNLFMFDIDDFYKKLIQNNTDDDDLHNEVHTNYVDTSYNYEVDDEIFTKNNEDSNKICVYKKLK